MLSHPCWKMSEFNTAILLRFHKRSSSSMKSEWKKKWETAQSFFRFFSCEDWRFLFMQPCTIWMKINFGCECFSLRRLLYIMYLLKIILWTQKLNFLLLSNNDSKALLRRRSWLYHSCYMQSIFSVLINVRAHLFQKHVTLNTNPGTIFLNKLHGLKYYTGKHTSHLKRL